MVQDSGPGAWIVREDDEEFTDGSIEGLEEEAAEANADTTTKAKKRIRKKEKRKKREKRKRKEAINSKELVVAASHVPRAPRTTDPIHI